MRHFKILLLSLTLISLSFVSCKNSKKDTITEEVVVEESTPEVEMEVTDDNPKHPSVDVKANQTITSPLTLNINSEGAWLANEGELGTVELFDKNNKSLGSAIMSSKDGEWMTTGPAAFIATLNFTVSEAQTGNLVFHNNVVSDEGIDREMSFHIPVKIAPSN